jgi:hypothetical protein
VVTGLQHQATLYLSAVVDDSLKALGFTNKGNLQPRLRKLLRSLELKKDAFDQLLASAKPLGKAGAMGQLFELASGEAAKVS